MGMRCSPRTLVSVCCLLAVTTIVLFLYRSRIGPATGYRERLTILHSHEVTESHRFTAGNLIPKILHQVFTSERVYLNYKPYINSCLSLNPDWEYYLWTDADAESLISDKYPHFLAKYKKYTDNLEKSDAIRYAVLHHMGGIYLDMDVECVKPFFPALSGIPAFIDQERTEQTSIHFFKPYSAMNSAMGSRPGHPFFQYMIKTLLGVSQTGDALRSTGPMVLTRAYESYSKEAENPPVTLMDPKMFSPLMNNMPAWQRRCNWNVNAAKDKSYRWQPSNPGCALLRSKQWRADDRDNSTIGVHRFLHLGYGWIGGRFRKGLFSVPEAFPGRVKFYLQKDYTQELKMSH